MASLLQVRTRNTSTTGLIIGRLFTQELRDSYDLILKDLSIGIRNHYQCFHKTIIIAHTYYLCKQSLESFVVFSRSDRNIII